MRCLGPVFSKRARAKAWWAAFTALGVCGTLLVIGCGENTPSAPLPTPCVQEAARALFLKPPHFLSETGLFNADGSLARDVEPFEPRYKLWSDGAEKRRFVYLPSCEKIDVSDMDHWEFPVGARFWKEFTRDGVRIETRFIERFGPRQEDWFFAAYLWDDNDSDAVLVPDGVPNAKGTTHDVPSQKDCKLCHEPQPEHILGFGALQLTHQGDGVTLQKLSHAGRLSGPVPQGFEVPGNEQEKAALGYLHTNCGTCHNRYFQTVNLRLRIYVADKAVKDTDTYTTTLGQEPVSFMCPGCQLIHPGQADSSVLVERIRSREMGLAMPPIASKLVDEVGLKAVSDWVNSL